MAGCGCLVVVLIALIVFLKLAMGTGPQILRQVPSEFPADIPVYDKDNIDQITFVSGDYKNRGIEIAAFFPKIILSPLFLSLDKNQIAPSSSDDTGVIASAKNLWKIIKTPVSDHRDTIQIEWKNLDAGPAFLIDYYKKELGKKDYTIDVESEGADFKQFSFSRGGITGSLYAQGNEDVKPGADYVTLTVNLDPSAAVTSTAATTTQQ